MTEKQKKSKSKSKSAEFCSAVEPFAHFACMRPATEEQLGRKLCAKHAKIFKPFTVYRALPDGAYETALVFQRPGSCQLNVVNEWLNDRRARTLPVMGWHRSLKSAYGEPLRQARRDVREARKYLTECEEKLHQMLRNNKS